MRLSKWSCGVFVLLLPVLIYGALQNRFSTASVSQWLPTSGEERERYAEFLERFGDDLFLVVSWPGCDLENPLVPKLVKALRQDSDNLSQSIVRIWTSAGYSGAAHRWACKA